MPALGLVIKAGPPTLHLEAGAYSSMGCVAVAVAVAVAVSVAVAVAVAVAVLPALGLVFKGTFYLEAGFEAGV